MQLPVTIELLRSPRLLAILALAHAAALAVLAVSQFSRNLTVILLVAILASAAVSARRAWDGRFIALHLKANGQLELEPKVGVREAATVLSQTTVLPGLVVLLLRRGGRMTVLTLFADATGRQRHRQLRLWLKWLAKPARGTRND